METSNNRLRRLLLTRIDRRGKILAPPLDLANNVKEFRSVLEDRYEFTRQLMTIKNSALPSHQESDVPALLKRQAG